MTLNSYLNVHRMHLGGYLKIKILQKNEYFLLSARLRFTVAYTLSRKPIILSPPCIVSLYLVLFSMES